MSKSKNLVKSKRTQVIGLVLLATSILAGTTFGNPAWRKSTSAHFLSLAQNTKADQSPIFYEFAALLATDKTEIRVQEAQFYLQQGKPDAAISLLSADISDEARLEIADIQYIYGRLSAAKATIEPTKQQSDSANLLRSRIYLESGDTGKAIDALRNLPMGDPLGEFALQKGLSYVVAGDSANASSLMGTVAPPEAVETLKQAMVGKYGLAVALTHSGLLNSAERVLDSLQVKATDEWQLWGTIRMAHKTSSTDLKLTEGSLLNAVNADPSNIRLRKLLREVYAKAEDESGVRVQTDLITRLESGTP